MTLELGDWGVIGGLLVVFGKLAHWYIGREVGKAQAETLNLRTYVEGELKPLRALYNVIFEEGILGLIRKNLAARNSPLKLTLDVNDMLDRVGRDSVPPEFVDYYRELVASSEIDSKGKIVAAVLEKFGGAGVDDAQSKLSLEAARMGLNVFESIALWVQFVLEGKQRGADAVLSDLNLLKEGN